MDPIALQPQIYSVSQLNTQIRQLLEGTFGEVWLQGEISNLKRPYSGHWYFSLKDHSAQVRCAMFKGQNRKVLFDVQDGQQVLLRAKISVYEPRGDYQLIVQSIQPDGLGAMQLAYEQLRCKLASEGVFNEHNKRPLPEQVTRVGVITSASGAAFHDITAVLKRLSANIEVILYPSSVQGNEAPEQLRQALSLAQERHEVDVIIIGRGGGSLEDLWAFNDERLTRQVAQCTIPIISAVGHEIDFTLTDFAADWRAPTPSAAAERVAYGMHQLRTSYRALNERLLRQSQYYLNPSKQHLQHLTLRLMNQSPIRQLQVQQQLVDDYSARLERALMQLLSYRQVQFNHLQQRLIHNTPSHRLRGAHEVLNSLHYRLQQASDHYIQNCQQRFSYNMNQLDNLSPLAVLARGYSAIKDQNGRFLTRIEQLKIDQSIKIELQDGQAQARITDVTASEPPKE